MATKDDGLIDLILSVPGMNEQVKLDFKISRKNALLLSYVIDRGLLQKGDDKDPAFLKSIPEANLEELKALSEDALRKAGLTDLSDKLKNMFKM